MSYYEYKCKHCGCVGDRYFVMGEAKDKVKCQQCGKKASRNWGAPFPAIHCRYSYFERAAGNPRVGRGKGR